MILIIFADQYVLRWLESLQREIEEPDLWESLGKYQTPLGAGVAPDTENSPFSAAEAKRLTEDLSKIREYLKSEFEGVWISI